MRISAAPFLLIVALVGVAARISAHEIASRYDWPAKGVVYSLSFPADALMLLLVIHPAPVQGMYLLSKYLNLLLAGFIHIRVAAVNFSRDV